VLFLWHIAIAQEPGAHPLVGAIRWDAWHGDLGAVGEIVERCLSPEQYRFRAPWFTEVGADGSLSIRCDRPGILEREIEYAERAGIDHWAFVTYPEEDALSLPLRQYLALGGTGEVGFCNIVEWARFGGPEPAAAMVERLVGYFRDPRYVRVLGDRPLLYLFTAGREQVEQQWGSVAGFHRAVDMLRAGARGAVIGDPYVVVMWFDARSADEIRQAIGADALSSYAVPGGTEDGAPFAQSLSLQRSYWDSMGALAPVIPVVSWGWDPRPRVDNPTPWAQYSRAHFATFTPEECATALREALDWISANPEKCPARAVIAYAWNEHDEGGWLCPTRAADGGVDASRVEAVGAMVRGRDEQ